MTINVPGAANPKEKIVVSTKKGKFHDVTCGKKLESIK